MLDVCKCCIAATLLRTNYPDILSLATPSPPPRPLLPSAAFATTAAHTCTTEDRIAPDALQILTLT